MGMSRTFQIPSPFPKMTAIESVMTATIFGNEAGKVKDPVAHAREKAAIQLPIGSTGASPNT